MDINHFFNDYGIPSQHKFVGRNEQLKEAGYDESGVENTFGLGWSNDGQYPQGTGTYGGFIDRSGQLSELGLNLEDYELVYGEGYVKKTGTEKRYLTFTAENAGSTLCLNKTGSPSAISLEYSVDGGSTWGDYTWSGKTGATITLANVGDSVRMRGVNSQISTGDTNYYNFVMTGSISASGDVTSLLNGVGGNVAVSAYCYYYMFSGCSSLTHAPLLPSTTLGQSCYAYMFYECTSLTAAPELPATTLAAYCYRSMFNGCRSLATAPELPATTLEQWCYQSMFSNCTSLATAPELPATTLEQWCYQSMFGNCTSLATAPELPATALATYCYQNMFSGCGNLQSIVCLATNISATGCTNAWVSDVNSTGVFIKDPSMTDWTTGNNGIPTGWIVVDNGLVVTKSEIMFDLIGGTDNAVVANLSNDAWSITSIPEWITASVMSSSETVTNVTFTVSANATDRDGTISITNGTNTVTISVSQGVRILTFTAENAGSTVHLDKTGSPSAISLEYSVDGGSTWNNYTWSGKTGATIALANVGDSVRMRGVNSRISNGESNYYNFVMTGSISASGEITSLLNGAGGDVTLKQYCYCSMFSGCTSLTTAPELPATTLAGNCYRSMFYGCAGLTSAPALPSTTLAEYCYASMFSGCTSLTTAPELPATTLADYCYFYMFSNCTSLATAPELPATTLATYCYQNMFNRCTSLATAPELPATTLATYCYQSMFNRCTSLVTAPELPATTLASNCYHLMFQDCTSLVTAPELPSTTLAEYCYASMFSGCTSLTSITCLATNISASYCTANWLYDVNSTGTFIKAASMTGWTTGASGIPSGWTVQDYQE